MGLHSNFAQYHFPERLLGVVRFDMAKNDLFLNSPVFDAVVTDRTPPPPFSLPFFIAYKLFLVLERVSLFILPSPVWCPCWCAKSASRRGLSFHRVLFSSSPHLACFKLSLAFSSLRSLSLSLLLTHSFIVCHSCWSGSVAITHPKQWHTRFPKYFVT